MAICGLMPAPDSTMVSPVAPYKRGNDRLNARRRRHGVNSIETINIDKIMHYNFIMFCLINRLLNCINLCYSISMPSVLVSTGVVDAVAARRLQFY